MEKRIGYKYINAHLDNVSVESLCEHLNLSRTALYNIFRIKTGQGVASFIRNKQLENAKKLLADTDLSISEISARCGFSDYNYFSRVFKNKYGVSARSQKRQ
ncbi:MAG: helix-turn-helix transcriptional regulator [Clostridia bacterium]|nr:helix-turn-helix transcriptional regulator [Clostridia bacterium]